MISVRYIVTDVDEAVVFYQNDLDFKVDKHNPGKFAVREAVVRLAEIRSLAGGTDL